MVTEPILADAVTFREQGTTDEAVVRRAHVAHRRQLLHDTGWPADMLARFCDQQHDLQERHIAAHHPAAERRMILVGGTTVGRLCLDRGEAGWRIVDLAIVPEAQGAGVGGTVLRLLIGEAARAGADIELQVGRDNPRAEALYRRLGFVEATSVDDTHRRLVRQPSRVS